MTGLSLRSGGPLAYRRGGISVLAAALLLLSGAARVSSQDWSRLENRALSLEECIEIARENNPGLARSEVGILMAEAGAMQAWSGILPTVRNSSAYSRSGGVGFSLDAIRLGQVNRDYYRNSFSVQQTLFNGGGNRARISSARSNVRAAENSHIDNRQDLDLEVKIRYIELLQAEALLQVRQETVDLSQQHVSSAEAFYRAGEKTQADVLRARVELSQNDLELITARNAVRTARATLASALGIPLDLSVQVRELAEPVPSQTDSIEKDLREALENHPLLRARRASQESAKATVSSAKSGRWPVVSASWDYSWSDTDWPRFSGSAHRWGSNDEWWLSVSVSLNIFDGLVTKSNIRRSEAELDDANESYRQALNDVALGVRRSHLDMLEARERIRAAGEGVSLAEEDRRLQEERYRLGEGTLLELNDSLVALTNARVSRITATYDYHLAKARMDRAAGRD